MSRAVPVWRSRVRCSKATCPAHQRWLAWSYEADANCRGSACHAVKGSKLGPSWLRKAVMVTSKSGAG